MPLQVKGKSAHVASRAKPERSKSMQRSRTSESIDQEVSRDNSTKLNEQYTTSLRQQVQLLQIENSFLRQHKNPQYERPSTQTTQILSRGNEVSLNGETWCQLPAFHPPLHSIISERSSSIQSQQRVPKLFQPSQQSIQESSYREKRDHSVPCSRTSSIRERQIHVADTELLHELEESAMQIQQLEKQLRNMHDKDDDHQKVIHSLTMKIKEIEESKVVGIESASLEKRALLEELLELQKRIDELTPVIAEKEVKIAQVENEKLELTKRLRIANTDISNMQITISQLKDELIMKNNKVKECYEDMKTTENRILVVESELKTTLQKDMNNQDKISNFSQQIREFELTRINDKKLIDQLMNENGSLIKENARITTQLGRLEESAMKTSSREKEIRESAIQNEVLTEVRSSLLSEKQNSQILTSKLEALRQRCADLEKTVEDRDRSEEEQHAERLRIEKELNALHALSKSLSSENKLLREEKLANEELIDELKGKVRALEAAIRSAQEIFNEKERHHHSRVVELEEEAQRKHQKYLEFEELSKTLHQITSLLPSKTSSMVYDCNKK